MNHDEASRLEKLWAGDFGDRYIQRNDQAQNKRDRFWNRFLDTYPINSVLEVGCNIGGNLVWVSKKIDVKNIHGIDVSPNAIAQIQKKIPGINAQVVSAKRLPFDSEKFELVFTAGVLIHQPEHTLMSVMSEIIRCSKKYVLCLEYFSDETQEVPYRGEKGALFKRNYGEIYQQLDPSLKLLEKGFMGKDEGWDDVTYWVFQK